MKFTLILLNSAALLQSQALELILNGEIEGDSAEDLLLEQEEGFL